MLVQICAEARQVVLEEKDTEELWPWQLNRHEPGHSDGKEQRKAWPPQTPQKNLGVAAQSGVRRHDQQRQCRSDWPLGQHAHRQQCVERRQPQLLAGFVPRPPGQHGNGKRGGDQHVRGSSAPEAEDRRRRSGDHRGVKFAGRTEAAHEKKHGQDQRCRKRRGRDPSSPITHAEEDVAVDLFPVKQYGLFQPGLTVERGQNPVMTLKHLATDLRIAWFVCAGQTEGAKTKKEKEKTDAQQHRQLQDKKSCPGVHVHAPAARSMVGDTAQPFTGSLGRSSANTILSASASGPATEKPLAHPCPPPPNFSAISDTLSAPLLRRLTRTRSAPVSRKKAATS